MAKKIKINFARLLKKNWLNNLVLICGLIIILFSGLYIFNSLKNSTMDSNFQTSKSISFNNSNDELINKNTNLISNTNFSSQVKTVINANTKKSSKVSRNSNSIQTNVSNSQNNAYSANVPNPSSVNMSGTIEGNGNLAVLYAVRGELRKQGLTGVQVGIISGGVVLRGYVPKGRMAEATQIAQEAGKRSVRNELIEK